MTRRLIRLVAFALVAMAAIAPIAQAHRGHHGRHHHARAVCGTLASVASDASSLVITTAHRGDVTITNPNAVTVDPTLIGTAVCARVQRNVATDGTRSLILVSVAAKPAFTRPYARAIAAGPVTLNGDGTITVASVTFIVPSSVTLPTGLADGDVVAAAGKEATSADTQFTLKRLWVRHAHSGHAGLRAKMGHGWHHGGWFWGGPHAAVSGPVTAYTAADATTAGSITVANVVFAIPAGTTLPHEPTVGDHVTVQGNVVSGVLTLTAGCGRRPH